MAVCVVRLALLGLLALPACAIDIGDPQPWVPIAEITGPLAPEQVAPTQMVSAGTSLRIVSYNVELGPDPEAIAVALRASELELADVVFVQEIEAYPAEGSSRSRRLADALGMGFVYAPARTEDGGGTHGLAILSHYELRDARVMRLPSPGAYPVPLPRIALAAEIDTPEGPLTLACVHLDTRLSAAERVLQLRPVVLDPPDRIVAGGDLNTSPFTWVEAAVPVAPAHIIANTDQGPVLDDYMRALGYATPTANVGDTQTTLGLGFRLDALYTSGVTPIAAEVDRTVTGSDHWPLILDLTL